MLDGLTLLKELNPSERLKRVPSDPVYKLCVLSTLRDRLRAGNVWVAGSRQYPVSTNTCCLSPSGTRCARLRHGRLTITPLRTTVQPAAEELGRRAYELLGWVSIIDQQSRSTS